jgi:hypothetical protein
LCNPTPEISDIQWHPTKIDSPKVFLLTRIKPEYSDILYNLTHFPGPLVCRIRQVPLYLIYWTLHVFSYFSAISWLRPPGVIPGKFSHLVKVEDTGTSRSILNDHIPQWWKDICYKRRSTAITTMKSDLVREVALVGMALWKGDNCICH